MDHGDHGDHGDHILWRCMDCWWPGLWTDRGPTFWAAGTKATQDSRPGLDSTIVLIQYTIYRLRIIIYISLYIYLFNYSTLVHTGNICCCDMPLFFENDMTGTCPSLPSLVSTESHSILEPSHPRSALGLTCQCARCKTRHQIHKQIQQLKGCRFWNDV